MNIVLFAEKDKKVRIIVSQSSNDFNLKLLYGRAHSERVSYAGRPGFEPHHFVSVNTGWWYGSLIVNDLVVATSLSSR